MSERFGAYEIESEVGRGGMGVVYRAREIALDRLVALKLIATEIADVPILRARFERESRLAASIDHPHIVTVHAVGEHEGRPFIAMQWVDGGDLRARLAAGPLPIADVLTIGAQVADALQAAHERGLLHRDVKPGNVLLRRGARPHALLADFGIARDQKADVRLTTTGGYVGTPMYTAPEQIAGTGSEPRSDVYSLGCVLFTCLTGAPPFGGGEEAHLRWAHLSAPRPHVRTQRPDAPQELDDLVRASIAVDPDDRPATARALAEQLEQIAGALGAPPAAVAQATVLPPAPRLRARPPRETAAETPPTAPSPAPVAPPPPPSRHRGPLIAAALAALAIAAVAAVVLLNGGGDDKAGTDTRPQASTPAVTPDETQSKTTSQTQPETSTTPPASTPADTAPVQTTPSGGQTPTASVRSDVRALLRRYLSAYAARSTEQLRPLLAPDVKRSGRKADGTCGSSSGRSAVLADYAYNFRLIRDAYRIQNTDRASSYVQLQDGGVETKGMTYTVGATQPRFIDFVVRFAGDTPRIASVRAFCA